MAISTVALARSAATPEVFMLLAIQATAGAAIAALFGSVILKAAITLAQKVRGESSISEGSYGKAYLTVFLAMLIASIASMLIGFVAIAAKTDLANAETLDWTSRGVGALIFAAALAFFLRKRHAAASWGTSFIAVAAYLLVAIAFGALIALLAVAVSSMS